VAPGPRARRRVGVLARVGRRPRALAAAALGAHGLGLRPLRRGVYVEVWAPETFAAPVDWRSRAQVYRPEDLPDLRVFVPHPHDVLCSKLERFEERDVEHAHLILAQHPMDAPELAARAGHAASHRRDHRSGPYPALRKRLGTARTNALALMGLPGPPRSRRSPRVRRPVSPRREARPCPRARPRHGRPRWS